MINPLAVNGNIIDNTDERGLFKKKVVLDPLKSFSTQVNKESTIYVIENDYDLNNEVVKIPRDSKLEFNGGTIGNGTVDFSESINHQVYYSWFSDFATCNRSLFFLDDKELVIDRDIFINESFSFPRNNFKHQNITIRGDVSTREQKPRIVADGVPCFKIYGHFFTIKDLSLGVRCPSKETACIEIESPMAGLNDVDCIISNCHFTHTGGGMAIKCKGRGIIVENCIFQTPTFSGLANNLNISAISLYPEKEPKYPVQNGTQWHDEESSGRGVIIRNNRLHVSYPGSLVGLYINKECSDWGFHGVQIVNNLVDAEGSLCVITAKNYGTLISGNINYGRRASSCMYIDNAYDMIVSNNVFGQLRYSHSLDNELYDIVFGLGHYLNDNLSSMDSYSDIKSVIVSNNILGSYKGVIFCDSGVKVSNLVISDNIFGKNSFENPKKDLGILTISNPKEINSVTIKNNCLPQEKKVNPLYCLIIYSSIPTTCKNIRLLNNSFFHNYLIDENVTLSNVIVHKSLASVGSTGNRPTNDLEPTDVGFDYFDTDLNKFIIWMGSKWIDAKGRMQ